MTKYTRIRLRFSSLLLGTWSPPGRIWGHQRKPLSDAVDCTLGTEAQRRAGQPSSQGGRGRRQVMWVCGVTSSAVFTEQTQGDQLCSRNILGPGSREMTSQTHRCPQGLVAGMGIINKETDKHTHPRQLTWCRPSWGVWGGPLGGSGGQEGELRVGTLACPAPKCLLQPTPSGRGIIPLFCGRANCGPEVEESAPPPFGSQHWNPSWAWAGPGGSWASDGSPCRFCWQVGCAAWSPNPRGTRRRVKGPWVGLLT